MLLAHCGGVTGVEARLERARELLRFLAAAQAEATEPAAVYVRQEVGYLLGAHPSYLYHEYLAETNEPLLFRDFAALARANGLQYLADATLATMFPSTLGSGAEEALAAVDDQLDLEQAIDFVRLRNFRRALLCHAEAAVDREIALSDVQSLAFYADLPALPPLVLDGEQAQDLPLAGGARATISHPLVKAALACLAITAIELVLKQVGLAASAATAVFLILSLGKATLVVMFFMHLRQDSRIYTAIFLLPVILVLELPERS